MQSLVSHPRCISPAHSKHDTSKDPFSAAESAIAIQMERMRAAEAIAARDVIAQHLSLACKTIREKSAIIDTLRQQNKYLEDILKEHTSSTLALAPASSALASQSEQSSPAGQDAPCARSVDGNSKVENSGPKDQVPSDAITEEEPPKYEVVTEALSQVWRTSNNLHPFTNLW
jgi:hypothetical protein